MKRVCIIVLLVIPILLFTGCKYPTGNINEIKDIAFVRAIGVDKQSENADTVKVTIVYSIQKGSSDSDKTPKSSALVYCSEGKTIAEALSKLTSVMDHHPYYGHASFIIFGENAANENVLKYMDFFFRYFEIRLDSRITIVKGTTAESVIREANTDNQTASDVLKGLFNQAGIRSVSVDTRMINLMNDLDNPNAAACISVVSSENFSSPQDKNSGVKIKLSGIAVFKKEKLVGYLNENEAKGFNWIMGKFGAGVITVNDPEGKYVSFKIGESEAKIIPQYINGKFSIQIKIRFSSSVAEQAGKADIYSESGIKYMQKQQEEYVLDMVNQAIEFARQNNTDIFNINDAIFHKYPLKWNKETGNLRNLYSDLKFNVVIESTITRTYDIKQPIGEEGGQ